MNTAELNFATKEALAEDAARLAEEAITKAEAALKEVENARIEVSRRRVIEEDRSQEIAAHKERHHVERVEVSIAPFDGREAREASTAPHLSGPQVDLTPKREAPLIREPDPQVQEYLESHGHQDFSPSYPSADLDPFLQPQAPVSDDMSSFGRQYSGSYWQQISSALSLDQLRSIQTPPSLIKKITATQAIVGIFTALFGGLIGFGLNIIGLGQLCCSILMYRGRRWAWLFSILLSLAHPAYTLIALSSPTFPIYLKSPAIYVIEVAILGLSIALLRPDVRVYFRRSLKKY